MPDKALDLLDEAAATECLKASSRKNNSCSFDVIARQKQKEREAAILRGDFALAAVLRDELRAFTDADAPNAQLNSHTEAPIPVIGRPHIAEAVSEQTGIPIGRITGDERSRLSTLEEALSARVMGQRDAVLAICHAVRRARTGLRDIRRPIGSFLFLGPTGVGKTELCRALADAYFGSESALLRFDMSEYMEKHSLSRLIGAPPGYAGYEDEGLLSANVRRRPYAVVLFDEIEKAHPDISGLLLQVLEDGCATDTHGRRIDFRNTIVILTSNIGATEIGNSPIGFANIDLRNRQSLEETEAIRELRRHFRPELLNRIDETVVFRHLEADTVFAIAKARLIEARQRIEAAGYTVDFGDDVVELIAKRGYSREYGARAIRRAVLRYFEDKFSLGIVNGEITQGVPFVAEIQNGEIHFREVIPCT